MRKTSAVDFQELVSSTIDDIGSFMGEADTQRLEASIGSVKDVFDVWVGLLSTGIEFKVVPEEETTTLADKLYTLMFDLDVMPHVANAIREWLTVGWAGIVITPYGPRILKVDEASVLPNNGYLRTYSVDEKEYKRRSGKTTKDDKVEVWEAVFEGEYLFGEGEKIHKRQPWRYLPRMLKGEERSRLDNGCRLPKSLFEHINSTCKKQDDLGEVVGIIGTRASLMAVDSANLTGETTLKTLMDRYNIIDTQNPEQLRIVDNRPLDEVVGATRYYDQLIQSRSGINSFMMGIRNNAKFAREIQEMQTSGSVRSQYIAEKVRAWLGYIVEDYRRYLVFLPEEDHMGVDITLEGREYSFGPAKPYSEVLEGKTIELSSAGQADMLQRRTDYQGLLAVLAALPQYDPSPLIDLMIKTYGLDPEKLRAEQQTQGPVPTQPQPMPSPEQMMPESSNMPGQEMMV